MKKRDLLLIALAIVILIVLFNAPKETTPPVPADADHGPLTAMVKEQGKRTVEPLCEKCHNPQDMPLSENHPPKARCLLCHKLPASK